MSCSETSISLRPKARITAIRITIPATIVGARPGCRPWTFRRFASGFDDSSEHIRWMASSERT